MWLCGRLHWGALGDGVLYSSHIIESHVHHDLNFLCHLLLVRSRICGPPLKFKTDCHCQSMPSVLLPGIHRNVFSENL
jgi:hypothetical protein